jgi:hypothetical protein
MSAAERGGFTAGFGGSTYELTASRLWAGDPALHSAR